MGSGLSVFTVKHSCAVLRQFLLYVLEYFYPLIKSDDKKLLFNWILYVSCRKRRTMNIFSLLM